MEKIIQMPYAEFQTLQETVREISSNQKKILDEMAARPTGGSNNDTAEYYSVKEFMARTKMSRWKFDLLRKQEKINTFKIGRIIYLHKREVQRYFTERPEID